MKLAVFTVMLPDLSPEEAAAEISGVGYDGVEWRVTETPEARKREAPSFWGNNLCTLEPSLADAARAKALAERYNLAMPNVGSYVSVGDRQAAEAALAFAARAGIPSVRIGAGTLVESYAASFKRATDFLNDVSALAAGYGVKALVETHHDTICPSASLAHRLVSQFDPELVGVIYDPGNMVYEGFETYRLGLELLGPYLAHAHIKSAAFTRSDHGAERGVWRARWAPLDDGVVNVRVFLAALGEVGYNGWLVVEDFSRARGGRETLLHNLRFLRDRLTPLAPLEHRA